MLRTDAVGRPTNTGGQGYHEALMAPTWDFLRHHPTKRSAPCARFIHPLCLTLQAACLSVLERTVNRRSTEAPQNCPNRQTRRNNAHTVSRLSKHLDSSLASDPIFHSGLSGDTHVLTNYDASCSTGESQAFEKAHLRNDLGLQPVWSSSGKSVVNHEALVTAPREHQLTERHCSE